MNAAPIALLTLMCAALPSVRVAAQGVGGQARPNGPIPVWIDTDPAVGVKDRDVDDGFALVQAFNSPEVAVRGVSVVFGNAPLPEGWLIGGRIVERFGAAGLKAYRGAASAAERGTETDASRALTAALRAEPLVVLALGPATNVATVLVNHPELAPRIVRIVAVAGRRWNSTAWPRLRPVPDSAHRCGTMGLPRTGDHTSQISNACLSDVSGSRRGTNSWAT